MAFLTNLMSENRRPARWLVYGAVAATGAVLAYYSLFSQFAYYDDEGYVLTSLSEFLHGGNLYDAVYSQYGPLYHEVFGAFFGLTGIEITNDHGRMVVLVVWVLTATGLGLTAEKITGRLSLGAITMLAGLGLLGITVASEPMHPIGLTTALIVAIFACAAWPARKSVAHGAIALGLVCGALAMIKINLGALAAVGIVAAALLTFGSTTRWARWVALGLLVLVPTALVAHNRHLDWIQHLLMLEVGGLVAIAIRAWPRTESGPNDLWRWALRFIAAFAAVCVVSLLVILILGSSVSGVFDALIRDPPKQTSVLLVQPVLPNAAILYALVAIALAFASRNLGRFADATRLLPARAIARVVVAIFLWLQLLNAPLLQLGPGTGRIALAMVLTWVAATPPREFEQDRLERFSRLVIVLVAMFSVLQAYPVAVSQLGAASVPFALVAAMIMSDGLRLFAQWGKSATAADRGGRATAAVVIVVAAGSLVALNGVLRPLRTARDQYRANVALTMHGATRIHVPAQQAHALEALTAALAKCDSIVGFPGANSFYIWTGKRPPTGQNATSWFELFSHKREQDVVDAIKNKPGFCLLRNDQAIGFAVSLSRSQKNPNGPLVNYLQTTPLVERLRVNTGSVAPEVVLLSRPDR
jgi:hypothetical protein